MWSNISIPEGGVFLCLRPCATGKVGGGQTGKVVRISERCAPGSVGSEQWALREAELSDDIHKRAGQLEEVTRDG